MNGSGSTHVSPILRRGPDTIRTVMAGAAVGWALLLTACTPSADQQNSTSRPAGGERPGDCVAEPGAVVQDIDPDDSPVPPWNKPAGQELVVEFETAQLSERYAGLVTQAAAIWSESPCLDAVAVQACSSGANCVLMYEDSGRSRNTDGEMEWDDDGAYMESATITLYTRPLDGATDNGALATVVHEMGHTLGLDHRLERSDVMNSVTTDSTDPVPDAVDFSNLVAIYGR